MLEPLGMYTASCMQSMVQIRKKNTYFVTNLLFGLFWKSCFGALGVESPRGGAIKLLQDASTAASGATRLPCNGPVWTPKAQRCLQRSCNAPGRCNCSLGPRNARATLLVLHCCYGPSVAPRNHSSKGCPKEYFLLLEKRPKANLSFEGVLKA